MLKSNFFLALILAGTGLLTEAQKESFKILNNGLSEFSFKDKDPVDWFNCTGLKRGIYPDPTTCDHYIWCIVQGEGMAAYQSPCGQNWDGSLLWYVPDSGPDESKACCDDPDVVDCPVTSPPATPTPVSDCKDIKEGSPCEPEDVECGQCDWCWDQRSYYFRCHQTRSDPFNPFIKTTGIWVKEECARGWMVDPTKPLASGTVGGQCTPWAQLDPTVAKNYLLDPNCGLDPKLCEYGQNEEDACTESYWFKMTGSGTPQPELCRGANDIWDVDTENCRPCSDVPSCAGRGKC